MYPPFTASYQGTKTISVTGSSVATALPAVGGDQLVLRAAVSNTVDCAFEIGSSTIAAATANGCPLSPGEITVITIPGDATHIALIASTTGQSVKITRGYGE